MLNNKKEQTGGKMNNKKILEIMKWLLEMRISFWYEEENIEIQSKVTKNELIYLAELGFIFDDDRLKLRIIK